MSASESGKERKTVREAIQVGFQSDIAKHKYLAGETAENQLEKLDIKYSKEAIFNQISQDSRRKQTGEEIRVSHYLDVATADIKALIAGIFGGEYKPKNNFSLNQKQKVLSYLYFKNKTNMDNPLKYKAAYGGIEKQDMEIYQLENKIQGIEKIKFDNRVMYLNQIAQCQNRIRYNGFLWGLFVSSIFWGTLVRKQSLIRKTCLTLTLIHIGGQFASMRSIDRVFDSVYPIFERDYNTFFDEEELRKKEHSDAGGIKTDEIRELLEESMKQIRQGKKIAKPAEEEGQDSL